MGMAFTLAVFLSAALLFLVEPMFGKMVLPLLGGSPSVWTTCMLFFQGALLLGYLYAHVGPRWLGLRWHTMLHILLLALCVLLLPIGVAETASTYRLENPSGWLLWVLTLSLGAPFTLLSSTGPLLQVWFSKTDHPDAADPYFLYGASNTGSLLALVSYPFLLEPKITLQQQARWWTLGYLVLVVLVVISAAFLRSAARLNGQRAAQQQAATHLDRRTMGRWIVLAFVPSSFFLALTTYLTTDVAAVPLLWIIPLVLYLLSFILVFGRRKLIPHAALVRWQPIGLISLVVFTWWGPYSWSPLFLPLHLIVFFITALVCHGELAASRPPASRLTEFYLCVAVGGVLGGLFNALVAPALFNSVLEYPLTLLLACAVRPRSSDAFSPARKYWDGGLIGAGCAVLLAIGVGMGDQPSKAPILIASSLAALMCLRMSREPLRFTLAMAGVLVTGSIARDAHSRTLLRDRNFFGVREVREDTQHRMRVLTHGTTKHGAQSTDPARRREPTSYYYRQGPVGDVFKALPPAFGRNVAVVGLGTGGLATYAGVGEHWTFYEIDPDIARLARNDRYFTYLQDTPASVDIVLGDGRLSLARAASHRYDVIVIDAFSSDAIPLHLLTEEAFSVYLSKLSDRGVLVFHLSNRYLELEPVVARLTRAAGLSGLVRVNTGIPRKDLDCGADPSIWAAAARRESDLGALRDDSRWRPLRLRKNVALWTDDFSNILRVFHLPRRASNKPVLPRSTEPVTGPTPGVGCDELAYQPMTSAPLRSSTP
jgi:hypothetical protein